MKILKPKCKEGKKDTKGEEGQYFNPMSYDGIKPRCICGYELLKETEDTYRCSGGHHQYRIKNGSVCFDKFGNLLLKIPKPKDKNEND